MTPAEIQSQIDALKAQQSALKRQLPKGPVTLRVGDKGGVSVYGVQRFPVTLYADGWEHLLNNAPQILAFIKANNAVLSHK